MRTTHFLLRVERPAHVCDMEAACRALAALAMLEGEFFECSIIPVPSGTFPSKTLDVKLQPEDQNHD